MCPSPCERRWLDNNQEYMREWARQYRLNHPKRIREQSKRYRKPQVNKATLEQQRAWHYIANHPELVGKECEFCESMENIKAHHPDYKYLDVVVTCCHSCHMYIHRGDED